MSEEEFAGKIPVCCVKENLLLHPSFLPSFLSAQQTLSFPTFIFVTLHTFLKHASSWCYPTGGASVLHQFRNQSLYIWRCLLLYYYVFVWHSQDQLHMRTVLRPT